MLVQDQISALFLTYRVDMEIMGDSNLAGDRVTLHPDRDLSSIDLCVSKDLLLKNSGRGAQKGWSHEKTYYYLHTHTL